MQLRLIVLRGAHGDGSLAEGLELLQNSMIQNGVRVNGGGFGKDVLNLYNSSNVITPVLLRSMESNAWYLLVLSLPKIQGCRFPAAAAPAPALPPSCCASTPAMRSWSRWWVSVTAGGGGSSGMLTTQSLSPVSRLSSLFLNSREAYLAFDLTLQLISFREVTSNCRSA